MFFCYSEFRACALIRQTIPMPYSFRLMKQKALILMVRFFPGKNFGDNKEPQYQEHNMENIAL